MQVVYGCWKYCVFICSLSVYFGISRPAIAAERRGPPSTCERVINEMMRFTQHLLAASVPACLGICLSVSAKLACKAAVCLKIRTTPDIIQHEISSG